jgi:hypothetical protein
MKKKLLIVGDSFSADWTKKYKNISGWVNMLEDEFEVTNVAQAGVSEYKIYLQLKSVNLKDYDFIIVSHTSAYRIPIQEHPIHKGDTLHNNCDLIFSDVSEYLENNIMKTAYNFYSEIFNTEYFCFINDLIFDKIYNLIPEAIHITFFDSFYDDRVLKYENIFLNNKGNVNHMDSIGNTIIFNSITKLIII